MIKITLCYNCLREPPKSLPYKIRAQFLKHLFPKPSHSNSSHLRTTSQLIRCSLFLPSPKPWEIPIIRCSLFLPIKAQFLKHLFPKPSHPNSCHLCTTSQPITCSLFLPSPKSWKSLLNFLICKSRCLNYQISMLDLFKAI